MNKSSPQMKKQVCPQCGGPLEAILSASERLNEDQWRSQIAGAYVCHTCPSNGRGVRKLCYWWESELPDVVDWVI